MTKSTPMCVTVPAGDGYFDYPTKRNVCRTHHIFKKALVKMELESDYPNERPRIFWTKVCRKCYEIERL